MADCGFTVRDSPPFDPDHLISVAPGSSACARVRPRDETRKPATVSEGPATGTVALDDMAILGNQVSGAGYEVHSRH